MIIVNSKPRGFKIKSSWFFLNPLVCSICAVIIYIKQDYRAPVYLKTGDRIAIRADILEHLTFGFKLSMADFLWLRLIQDFDFHDSLHVSKGWSYHMLDAITTLDRRYRMAYISGATVLSVLVEDVEGARLIFDRGIKNFPDDWSLIYRAGYHYLYEVKDCPHAAYLLTEASKVGAPKWVIDLAARLYTKSGQIQLARSVLVDSIERFKGTELEAQLTKRLNELDESQSLGKLSASKEAEVFENCKPKPPSSN